MCSGTIQAKGLGLCLGYVDESNVLLSMHLPLNAFCLHTKSLFSLPFEAKSVHI